jgi:beta-glucosidase-like glycosyl hydrolase
LPGIRELLESIQSRPGIRIQESIFSADTAATATAARMYVSGLAGVKVIGIARSY